MQENPPAGLYVYTLSDITIGTYSVGDESSGITGSETVVAGGRAIYPVSGSGLTSFDDIYSVFASPNNNSVDTNGDIRYTFPATDATWDSSDGDYGNFSTSTVTDKTNLAIVIQGTGSNPTTSYEISNDFEVKDRTAQIALKNYDSTVTLTFSAGKTIKISDGGKLLLSNDTPSIGNQCNDMQLKLVLAEPIEVSGNGSALYLEPRPGLSPETLDFNNYARDIIVAPAGQSAIVINNGGEVRVSRFDIVRSDDDTTSENVPLIEVADGSLIFSSGSPNRSVVNTDKNGMPKYETAPLYESEDFVIDLDNGNSSSPAVSVADGAEVIIEGGSITGSGDTPLIEVADGATLTISGENTEINTTSTTQPAIEVASGGSIVYKDNQATVTTGTGNEQAVTLAANSTVRMGDTEVTVSADTTGDNYVDNNGIAVFSAGASSGSNNNMNAAVLLSDGTLIEGSTTEAPTVNDDGSVTVPSGGAVTGSDGERQTLPTGGSVTQDDNGDAVVEKNPVNVTGVSINKETTTILVGGTETLTAEVTPAEADDKTVTWNSSDTNVVTVNQNGQITGVAVGTATITVTTADGNFTDTCNVIVSPVPVPATGIELNQTEVWLYSNTSPGTVTLTATVTPTDSTDTVTWSSSDEAVAIVENGVVTAEGNGTATITARAGEFEAACSVHVTTYTSGGGGGGTTTYTVNVENPSNGSVFVSPSRAERGETVTITVSPDDGYELDSLSVMAADGNEIDVTRLSDTRYSFIMPSGRVTVEATFTEIESEIFSDVPAGEYYYNAVYWAVENGITDGTSATTFSPNASCTRAQMVTFLWRAAGSPEPESTVNPFTDVFESAYYYDAVLWAVEQGITNGTSATTFSPDATVTRGQTVAFLWRYDGEPTAGSSGFADVAPDAYYASAVAWAVENGITNGTGTTTFSPDADCVRAQIVTFLYRFMDE